MQSARPSNDRRIDIRNPLSDPGFWAFHFATHFESAWDAWGFNRDIADELFSRFFLRHWRLARVDQ